MVYSYIKRWERLIGYIERCVREMGYIELWVRDRMYRAKIRRQDILQE